jgi:hypothetical protein
LKVAGARFNALSNERKNSRRNLNAADFGDPVQHSDPGFEARRVKAYDKTRIEATDQALGKRRDAPRRSIRGCDNRTTQAGKLIEDVEELLLASLLPGKMVKIVDEKDTQPSKVVPKLVEQGILRSLNEPTSKRVRRHVAAFGCRVSINHTLSYPKQKVRLSKPGSAMNKQGVISRGRTARNRDGSGMGESAAWTADEVVQPRARITASEPPIA